MNKKWEYYEIDENIVGKVATKYNVSRLLAKILINRNLIEDEKVVLSNEEDKNIVSIYLQANIVLGED